MKSDKLFDVGSGDMETEYGPEDYQTGFAVGRLAEEGLDLSEINLDEYTSPDPLDLLIAAEDLGLDFEVP